MPNGGKLTVKTVNAGGGTNYPSDSIAAVPGPYVLLEISDTGVGMDAETQAHIFEPFFTTKEVGKGTGLGLSTVYGVIKQSGGQINVESSPDRGTTFSIYLPWTAEAVTPAKPAPDQAESLRGTETVLLVEDADSVRELARDWLMASGYTVLEADCPEDALQISRTYPSPVHLLVTDVIMPGMNGPALARKVMRERPETKLLYVSGYTGFIDQKNIDPEAPIVPKPFTRDSLLSKLREVLSGEVESLRT
jgi:CheY-like chemotaxis protein